MIDTLVFGGGGYKGLAYVGVLKALDQLGFLRNIRHLIGCSIGGVMMFLIAIGYTHQELEDFVYHFDYRDVNDLSIMRVLISYGVDTGDRIMKLLKIMMRRKLGVLDITFKELRDRTGYDLCLNAVCLNTHQLIYHNADKNPDMSVLTAVRMTFSLPILFTPVEYMGHLYVDGGLLQNFPISMGRPGHTIGVSFERDQPDHQINSIESYLMGLWTCVYRNANRLEVPLGYQAVLLHLDGLCTLAIGIDQETRHLVYQQGYQQTLDGFSTHPEVIARFIINKIIDQMDQTDKDSPPPDP